MRDLLPFLRLYRHHAGLLTAGMLLTLFTLLAGIGLLSLRLVFIGIGGRRAVVARASGVQLPIAGWRGAFFIDRPHRQSLG